MTGAVALAWVGVAPAAVEAQQSAAAARSLVFDGVTVVDVEQGKLIPAQRVVIAGNRIQTVGAVSAVKLPARAQVVDARGKYLIPGFWDMHVHVIYYPQIFYPMLIANGVTGIRDASTPVPLDTVLQWRREIAAATRVGPRMIVTGASLDDQEAICGSCNGRPQNLQVSTPAEGRHAVDSLQAAGADFIKVHNLSSREVYFAIAAEARRLGIPISGHLPPGITAIEVADSGQRAIDHYLGAANLGELCLDGKSASAENCAPVVTAFTRNGTWFVPTLALNARVGEPLSARMAAWRQQHPVASESDDPESEPEPESEPASPPDSSHGLMDIARQSGLPVLTGTDATPDWMGVVVPGASVHDEMSLLVTEGMTILGALQAATLNPAKFLRATDSLGTVAPGKLADLVLLDADPLADIANTRTIRMVVANGRYFGRKALDRLLVEAEAKAAKLE